MMAINKAVPHVGDVGTKVTVTLVDENNAPLDMSTLSEAVFRVIKPDKSVVSWTNVVVIGSGQLQYVIQEGDWDISGSYTIVPEITLALWQGSAFPIQMYVYAVGS